MEKIIQQFLPKAHLLEIIPLTGGLIHQTYKATVRQDGKQSAYILQRFSQKVFKSPQKVMSNLLKVQQVLETMDYPLVFPKLIQTTDKEPFLYDELKQYWRVFEFVEGSTSFESPPSAQHLFNAGKAYGIFLTALKDLDPFNFEITIPHFHDLSRRFDSFKEVVDQNLLGQNQIAVKAIKQTMAFYEKYPIDLSDLPLRITHNDCKLSNVLFKKGSDECIAVIDLDTVMPGYVVTDFGDMVRTMCNTADEEEKDLSKVSFDHQSYDRLKTGFLERTNNWLTLSEKQNLRTGTIYIILEQAIRFLTDYLAGDPYYGAKYPSHNLLRAENQLKLLSSFLKSK